MSYLTGTKAQIDAQRVAFAEADGLPVRGVVVGGPDFVPSEPGPGWTIWNTSDPVEAGAACALEIPAEVERHLGTRVGAVTLPTRAALKEETTLSSALQTKIRERRGDAGAVDPRVKTADGRDVADGSGRPVLP